MIDSDQLKHMTAVEQRLYGYILENKQQVKYMRIRELAQLSGVSATTIVRFSKKIGCEGFAEFRLKLQHHQQKVAKKAQGQYHQKVEKFLSRVKAKDYQQKITAACTLILKTRFVVFFGEGQSSSLAEYGSQLIAKTAHTSFFSKEVFMMGEQQPKGEIVAIILSPSGEDETVIEQVEILKKQQQYVISITNTHHNTLAHLSDVNIAYYMTSVSTVDERSHSQVPVLYILEELADRL